MGFYTFTDNATGNAEKETWLVQHVPHRICAALAWLPMKGKWAMPPEPVLPKMDFHVWCIGRSVDEGRKASMRWLIEFIGITLKPSKPAKNGKPAEEEKAIPIGPHDNGKSVTIQQVGGTMFDPNNTDALKLAKIWQACSQASLHPTMDTKHDDLGEKDLAGALQIVLTYLEKSLYEPKELDLFKIVREQEKLAIARKAAADNNQCQI